MSWIETVSGRKIDFLNPDPEQFYIEDIALALSRIPRFVGHTDPTRGIYSVASHSIYVSRIANDKGYPSLEFLMHDATEAYTNDIPRPLKQLLGPAIKDIEDRLTEALCIKFELDISWLRSQELKDVDYCALLAEARDLKPARWEWDEFPPGTYEPCRTTCVVAPPQQIEKIFLNRFRSLDMNRRSVKAK